MEELEDILENELPVTKTALIIGLLILAQNNDSNILANATYNAFRRNAIRAGIVQARALSRSFRDEFIDVIEPSVVAYEKLVVKQAVRHVAKAGTSAMNGYSNLAAWQLVLGAFRLGTVTTAEIEGARFKKFIRVNPAKEPRAHSKLEGKVIGINEKWNINGYKVPAPGHEDLPWSEKAQCGHINEYLFTRNG